MTVHGCNVGAWINRQREHAVWQNLIPGQRRHMKVLGLPPLPASPAKKKTPPAGAFKRGVLVLQQYKNRTGTLTVLQAHIEP